MQLKGSCHCQTVQFTVNSKTPYPFEKCYCSICRKTAGGGAYAIHVMADYPSMQITGKEFLQEYRAEIQNPEDDKPRIGEGINYFCKRCGSALWKYDPRWPEWVYLLVGIIDSDLPKTDEHVHILTEFAVNWAEIPEETNKQRVFKRYPDKSIYEWHQQRELLDES